MEPANQFHRFLVKGGDFTEMALGLLNKQIRLVEEGQESILESRNYSFLKMHPFWQKLTDLVAPLKLVIPKPVKTIQSTLRYVKNAGASIKALRGVMDDFNEFFDSLVDDAKLKPSHIAMQDDYFGYEGLCFPSCVI